MSKNNQPDWGKIAEKFDMWLPHLSPVGEMLLSALQARSGDRIIDLASGTGEPALSLARRFAGSVAITGIDAAEGMVKVAQSKVDREGITNTAFQCMAAEQLTFADNSFDRALRCHALCRPIARTAGDVSHLKAGWVLRLGCVGWS